METPAPDFLCTTTANRERTWPTWRIAENGPERLSIQVLERGIGISVPAGNYLPEWALPAMHLPCRQPWGASIVERAVRSVLWVLFPRIAAVGPIEQQVGRAALKADTPDAPRRFITTGDTQARTQDERVRAAQLADSAITTPAPS
ncbi:hypothetical protein RM550_16210 [Streptomyces sp. DSM 41527]|uniref:LysR substrate-binding domain-containing protein n=1 Tax=Streptomyces mooreae TaxID=3075523 RepID=A0ABU2T8K8_9ACTN|nr:hypothetical protein [Streptomyces sp. DSM 41527]MDT0457266.1 hypothetical protein [Streptomyces sp. DSM 41527]